MNNQDLQTFLNIIDGRIKKYINENKLLKQYCGRITGFVENNNFTKYKVRLLGDEEEFVFLNKTGESLKIGDFVYIQTVGTDLNTGVIIYKTQESLGDFIIEQGTTDIWTWEKWNSGKAVCWGNVDMSNAVSQGENNCYVSIIFPLTFTSIPSVQTSNCSTAPAAHYGSIYSSARGVQTSQCQISMRYPTGLPEVYQSVYVIGKWK